MCSIIRTLVYSLQLDTTHIAKSVQKSDMDGGWSGLSENCSEICVTEGNEQRISQQTSVRRRIQQKQKAKQQNRAEQSELNLHHSHGQTRRFLDFRCAFAFLSERQVGWSFQSPPSSCGDAQFHGC